MKSLMLLWQEVLNELGTWCRTSTTMDRKTAHRRFEDEGLSFLTITLPNFGADLQKGLDLGYVDHDHFAGFKRSGGLPRFLGGFLDLVFDRKSGVLLEQPSIDAIFALRQLTLMMSKVSLPCAEHRNKKAIEGYLKCEQELKQRDSEWTVADYDQFSRMSRLLFSELFTWMDLKVYSLDITPKHGPGATADKLRGNAKYDQNTWTTRLESILPAGEFLLPNWRYFPRLESVQFLEPSDEIPVKVTLVPKTLKTPRIIAIEPTHMQYMQQALLECFLEGVKRDDILSSFLGFDDQIPNQEMARIGSLHGSLATLDLSEASDRVSNQQVRVMLDRFPHVAAAIDASRSRKADVPGHGVIRLAKFASMGSAVCFPFEAAVFLTVVFCGIEDQLNTRLTKRALEGFLGSVRIFGDDIIVPKDYVQTVVSKLEAFGFRVNAGKSFWTGKFRESCGKEYYDGHDVSIVKVRQLLPTQRQHVAEVVATVSLRNQLYKLGLWQTCQWLDQRLARILRFYPSIHENSAVLGRITVLPYTWEKLHPHYHSPLVKGYVVASRLPASPLDSEGALLKFFLKRGDLPVFDPKHLERAGRPKSSDIKLRWASPF